MATPNGRKQSNGNHGNSRVRYLRCQAEPGMFSGELLVYLSGIDPVTKDKRIKVQLLADESEVEKMDHTPKRNQPASGWLRVTLAGETGNIAEVVLPQPAQPVGESMLVEADELKLT